MDQQKDEFVKLLTASQSVLYACILSLLPDRVAANDVLQETNLVLWHKADNFKLGTNFVVWASQIARYQVMNYRRKMRRDRLVFDEAVFSQLCERQAAQIEQTSRYAELLRECLGKLPERQRELLEKRYEAGTSLKQVALSQGRTENAVSQMLYRIRESLLNCVTQRMNEVTS